MAEKKRKSITSSHRNKADGRSAGARLQKRPDIMAIELEIYREIGGLAVKGRSRSFVLSRMMDYALKAMEADLRHALSRGRGRSVIRGLKGPGQRSLKD